MSGVAISLNPNQVSPGLLGFIIVCILGVAVWLLCRNMGKHLTKLDAEYRDEQAKATGQDADSEESADAPAVPAQQK
ncbi:hypothetical protein KDK95_13645 [Actinospica sp. MGRD01-02]|uniref:Uncharacterized protein n=1 Tax=Actinospica acidithermotolerans TaxID=2828514 RepID=A0A941E9C0_9ACTN|nr:hypothetical protein [Actinospica acidithermotolerans]MBR7827356.1 hypothetical protein [Actinospica acidithermotolerans]